LTKVVRNAGRQLEDDPEIMEIRQTARNALDHPALESLLEEVGSDLMPSVAINVARQAEEIASQVARQQRDEELQQLERDRRQRYDEGVAKLQEDLDNGELTKDEYLARLADLQAAEQGPTPSQDADMEFGDWGNRDQDEVAPPPKTGEEKGKKSRAKPFVSVPVRKSKSFGVLGRRMEMDGDDDGEEKRPAKKSRSDAGDPALRKSGMVRRVCDFMSRLTELSLVQSVPQFRGSAGMRHDGDSVWRAQVREVLPRSQGVFLRRAA
jgi:hypothetical protein